MPKISPFLVTIIPPNFVLFLSPILVKILVIWRNWWVFKWQKYHQFWWQKFLPIFVSFCHHFSVTCESLVSREFSRILLTFHFLISISRHFHFTFHSRSQGIFISLFILEMSERKTKFTFQFSKRVKAFQISLFFSRKKSEIVHVTSYFVMTNSHFW